MKKCLLLSLVLLATASANAMAGGFIDVSDLKKITGLEFLPTAEDYPNADGVYLYEKHDVEIQIDNNGNLYTDEDVHVIQRLFKNLEEHATVELSIYEGEKLLELEARTIKADGSVVKVKKKDIYQIKGEGDQYVIYSNVTKHKFTFPSVDKGSMVEYRYLVRKGFAFIRDVWNIQHYFPTVKNCYYLTVPEVLLREYKWAWRYRIYNYDKMPELVRDNPDMMETGRYTKKSRFRWEVGNLPAFESDPEMPPHSLFKAYMKFAPSHWKKWGDVAEWYYPKYFKPQLVIDGEVQALSSQLTKDCPADSERMRKLYTYVQGLRYISVDLGESGLRPSFPKDVIARKYGDCKDKSTLLIALLKSSGMEAHPALVLTNDDGAIDANFPNWRFNHMIVKAIASDGQQWWLDPTSKYCRLGELPYVDEGIEVLVIKSDSACAIEKTWASKCHNNIINLDIAANLTSIDSAIFKVAITYQGQEAVSARYAFEGKSERDLQENCKSLIAGEFVDATVANCAVSNLDSVDKELKLQFEFTVANAVQQQGDLLLFNFDPMALGKNLKWLRKEKRTYPIEFDYPFTFKKNFTVSYPAGRYLLRNRPRNCVCEGPSLYFRSAASDSAPGRLSIAETYRVTNKRIDPGSYQDVLNFYNEVQKHQSEKIIFSKKI